MTLTPWETVWICTGISVLALLVDALLATKAGASKAEQQQRITRARRNAKPQQ